MFVGVGWSVTVSVVSESGDVTVCIDLLDTSDFSNNADAVVGF